MRRLLLFLLPCLIAVLPLRAAEADTTISLITCYPGHDIYELEGHTGLRVRTPGADVAVSYGLFDFAAPNFVYRFVKGETDYRVGIMPWEYFFDSYRADGRRVDEQILNLDSEQKARLLELLEINLRPENRVYRYNYVKDNCATRPLAIVERAIGDSISLSGNGLLSSAKTFRDVMRHYHRDYPWYQFGIDLALGSGIDYPISSREYTFVPLLLKEQLVGAETEGKVIAQPAITLLPQTAPSPSPTPFYLSPLFVCWLVFALLLIATVRDLRRGRVTRWVDAAYFGALGLAGLLIAFLVFISVHEATSPNWLIFWLNPLCLIPTIFIWIKKCRKLVFCYQIINFAVVLIILLAWPLIPQSANAAFLPLVLGDLMRAASYIYLTIRKK